jgi:ankyrin repeat protein
MPKTSHAVRALACAAGLGDVETAREILKTFPDAARDWRPIMEASYKGFAPVVALLVKHGADVNAISSSEQNRPLHRAAEEGHMDVVDVLLRSGADIEARGTWMQIKPLAKAAFEGRPDIVRLLLEHGAKIDRFSSAAIGKSSKVTYGIDDNSLTTLHYCAGSALNHPALVKIAQRLIESGADVSYKASKLGHAVTPIKLATRNQPVAELLMDHGANPNDVFRDVLLTGCNYSFANLLLARGAELNPVLWGGETLLHVAIHWGRISSAEWLLKHGANPNTSREKDGWSPLHQAASRGVASIVTSLLEHGADPAATDHQGRKPLDVAREKRRGVVADLLTAN